MICKTLFHFNKVQIKVNSTILLRDAYINGKTVKKEKKSVTVLEQMAIERGGKRVVFIPRAIS